MRLMHQPPTFNAKAFTCPSCHAYSKFDWEETFVYEPIGSGYSGICRATCQHCNKPTFWVSFNKKNGILVYPSGAVSAPPPHEDMPDALKEDFEEARSIVDASPRGAAALLRLAIQKLCKELGQPGKDINKDIGEIVKLGLPIQIQQALDIVRVTGNNAVHPGQMQLSERKEDVFALFGLINLIVDNRISQPKKIANLYGTLPTGALEAIDKRDGKS